MKDEIKSVGWFHVECVNPDGSIAWVDDFPNMATTLGKNHMLNTEFGAGTPITAWYCGLIDNVGFSVLAAGDTMASHAGWTESVAYSNGTRVAPSWSSASAGSKASTTTAFNINASDTIKGVFLNTVSTNSGTTGTLYSSGLFTGGDQVVTSGGTLNVTFTAGL